MKKPLKIGLTGGIGSGKSTVCRIFEELSVPVIDADEIARDLLTVNSPAYRAVKLQFGNDVISENGEIDRTRLRELVFNDISRKKILENILHPLVYSEIDKQVLQLDSNYCIISVPLLIETKAMDKFDRILVVVADDDIRLHRAASRDDCTVEKILKIDVQQASNEQRNNIADDIIHNNGNLDSLRQQVTGLDEFYTGLVNDKI